MIFVSSDLHGYPLSSFHRLLDKAHFSDSDELIVLGDVIDRNGDGGIAMLRWMMQQYNVWMLMGNHEAMLLSCAFLFDSVTDESIGRLDAGMFERLSVWQSNGAAPTMSSMQSFFHDDPESAAELMDYLREAPLWHVCEAGGKRYVLTHSGLGNFYADKPLSAYSPDDLLWHRPSIDERYWNDTTVVFGHTPTVYYGSEYADRMLRTPTWINIDTGAGSGRHPMLLRLGDDEPFYMT